MEPLAKSHVIIANNRIAYGILGNETGAPVVLLHGTPSSSLIWRNIVPRLTAGGYRVHLYDLLGYGLSERPSDPNVDTSITAQVPVLEGLLQYWKLDSTPFHLVAHDIGGAIAQRFAIFNPRRLNTLTMIDVVSFDSYPSRRTKQQMERGLETLMHSDNESHRAHFKEWLLSAVVNKSRFESTSLPFFLEYISGPIGQPSIFTHQIRHYDPKHTMEIAGRYGELGNLKAPVKLIWGANDQWQVVGWGEKLRDAIPGSEMEVIKDAGHFSLEDQPEKIAEIMVNWLVKHK